MRRVVISAFALAACTASELDDALWRVHVQSESEFIRRFAASDFFELAQAHWRFYDDYLDTLSGPVTAQCLSTPDAGDGVPDWPYLWRRGMHSFSHNNLVTYKGYGERNVLDVTPSGGLVAIHIPYQLWIFDTDGGMPLHADEGSPGIDGPGNWLVAFATDSLMWTSGGGVPALLDITRRDDELEDGDMGWKVVYSWRNAHGTAGSFDYWHQASKAMLSDGTLVWTSGAGVTRALRLDGGVKWEQPAKEGTLLVTANDVVVRDDLGVLVAFNGSSGFRMGRRVEVKSSTVKVDGSLKIVHVSVAVRPLLDSLHA